MIRIGFLGGRGDAPKAFMQYRAQSLRVAGELATFGIAGVTHGFGIRRHGRDQRRRNAASCRFLGPKTQGSNLPEPTST